jgi:hypothetical protein
MADDDFAKVVYADDRPAASIGEAVDLARFAWDQDRGRGSRPTTGLSEWAESGFPIIELEPRLAHALMCTDFGELDTTCLRLPFRAFIVSSAETESTIESIFFDSAGIKRDDGLFYRISVNLRDSGSLVIGADPQCLLSLGRTDFDPKSIRIDTNMRSCSDREMRVAFLAVRVVVGACLHYFTKSHQSKTGLQASRSKKLRGYDPVHRIAFLGCSVQCDTSEHVRSYVCGTERRLRSVQFLVRGHWRVQPCGKGLLERKTIWIQPFWKGPEEAVIKARSWVFRSSPDTAVSRPRSPRSSPRLPRRDTHH